MHYVCSILCSITPDANDKTHIMDETIMWYHIYSILYDYRYLVLSTYYLDLTDKCYNPPSQDLLLQASVPTEWFQKSDSVHQ